MCRKYFFLSVKHYILREIDLSFTILLQWSLQKCLSKIHKNSGCWRKDLTSERELGTIDKKYLNICNKLAATQLIE